jgi:hypothetical protein
MSVKSRGERWNVSNIISFSTPDMPYNDFHEPVLADVLCILTPDLSEELIL